MKKGFGAADVIAFGKHVIAMRAMGVPIGPEIEAFAVKAIELVSNDAASLTDRGRHALAIVALGFGAFDAVGRFVGAPLPSRVEPGKTHSFGHAAMAHYLAAALKAKQPARDVEPAFREVVAYFPYSLETQKLDYADLVAIARAYYVHALGRSAAQVMELLHAEVRGAGPATPPVVAAAKEPPADPPKERGATWTELVANVRANAAANLAWVDAAVARLPSVTPDSRWLLLAMIAESLDKVAVACGPETVRASFARIDPMLADWVGEVRGVAPGQGDRLACALSYFDAARCAGAPLLPVAAAAERFVYPQIAELARDVQTGRRAAMAFGAIAIGGASLVEAILKPKLMQIAVWPEAEALARALAFGGDPAAAWTRLVDTFPGAHVDANATKVTFILLLAAARAFLGRVEARATDTIAQRLHEIASGRRAPYRPYAPPTRAEEFGLVYNAAEAALTLDGANALVLVHRDREWRAELSPDAAPHVVAAIVQGLRAARFPEIPPHPPGQAYRVLCANGATGESVARIEWNSALAMPGYREIFGVLDGLVTQMSGGEIAPARSALPPALKGWGRVR